MRELNSTAQAEILKKLGTEPVSVIEVVWNDTSTFYADKDLDWADGRIKTISSLDEVIRLETGGTSSQIAVEIVDTDGSFLELFNSIDLHKRPCRVYQAYEGLAKEDMFLLLEGEVLTPIRWNEADRTFGFEIANQLISNEVGFSPESGQLPDTVDPFAIGKPWPLCFGKPVHVPGTKIEEVAVGSNATYFMIPDPALSVKQIVILGRLNDIANNWVYILSLIQSEDLFGIQPQEVIANYTSVIVNEDTLKQQREDLLTEIRDIESVIDDLKQLQQEALTQEVSDAIGDQIASEENRRDALKAQLAAILESLTDVIISKAFIEVDVDVAEYEYNLVGRMRQYLERLIGEYRTLIEEYNIITTIIDSANSSTVGSFTMVNSERFEQGTLDLIVNGVRMSGVLSGNEFTVSKILPNYTNVEIADRPNRDSFIISDTTINLEGMYCLTDDSRIFQVREQIGQTCYVDPVSLKRIDNRRSNSNLPDLNRLKDLDPFTWGLLNDASEKTSGERQQILESSVLQGDDGEGIRELKKKIEGLSELAEQSEDEEVFRTLRDAIFRNMRHYNSLVSNSRIPENVLQEANALISQQEFETLLRLVNLDAVETERRGTPLEAEIDLELYYLTADQIENIVEVAPIILPDWMTAYTGYAANPYFGYDGSTGGFYNPIYYLPNTGHWIAQPGSSIKDNSNFQEKFVANILESEVKTVYAYRGVEGVRQLFPVPSSYYDVTSPESFGEILLADETTTPLNATTISFKRPLSEYVDEGWEGDDIFVTLSSSVGQNVVDVIRHLLTTYSDVTIDETSFDTVHGQVAAFPVNFAVLDRPDVLDLVRSIAFQARCEVRIVNKVATMVYLPKLPVPIRTFNETDIEFQTLVVETVETEDIVTKFIAQWKPHYEQQVDNQEIVRFNIRKYGVQEESYPFNIYNNQDLVQHAATFWSMRKANVWKRLTFKTFLTNLDLQTGDAITINLTSDYFATEPVIALVDKITYDSSDQSITLRVDLPVRLGETTTFEHYWPADIETIYPIINDQAAGYAGDPFHFYIRQDSQFNITPGLPIEPFTDSNRPRDYGAVRIDDSANLDTGSIFDSALALPTNVTFQGLTTSNTGGNDIFREVETTEPAEYLGSPPKPQGRGSTTPRETPEKYPSFIGTVEGHAQTEGADEVKSRLQGNISGDKDADNNVSDGVSSVDSVIDAKVADPKYYRVRREDGTSVLVRQMQIRQDCIIPNGTKVNVNYNTSTGDYEMQVPVWL